jgi:hypothetical protein
MSMTGRFFSVDPTILNSVSRDGEAAERLVFESDTPELDIDKSWHLIHFLLSGERWTAKSLLGRAVLGGTEIKNSDGGYGPIRYLTHTEVRAISDAIQTVSPTALWSRFNPEEVQAADIYPGSWELDAVTEQYVLFNYASLQAFYASASNAGNGVLLCIS